MNWWEWILTFRLKLTKPLRLQEIFEIRTSSPDILLPIEMLKWCLPLEFITTLLFGRTSVFKLYLNRWLRHIDFILISWKNLWYSKDFTKFVKNEHNELDQRLVNLIYLKKDRNKNSPNKRAWDATVAQKKKKKKK